MKTAPHTHFNCLFCGATLDFNAGIYFDEANCYKVTCLCEADFVINKYKLLDGRLVKYIGNFYVSLYYLAKYDNTDYFVLDLNCDKTIMDITRPGIPNMNFLNFI